MFLGRAKEDVNLRNTVTKTLTFTLRSKSLHRFQIQQVINCLGHSIFWAEDEPKSLR